MRFGSYLRKHFISLGYKDILIYIGYIQASSTQITGEWLRLDIKRGVQCSGTNCELRYKSISDVFSK